MLYAIISQDVENSLEKRIGARPEHIDRLNKLKDEGRLILAGPHPAIDNNEPGEAGFTGSLVVAEFEDLQHVPLHLLLSDEVIKRDHPRTCTLVNSSIHSFIGDWLMRRAWQILGSNGTTHGPARHNQKPSTNHVA